MLTLFFYSIVVLSMVNYLHGNEEPVHKRKQNNEINTVLTVKNNAKEQLKAGKEQGRKRRQIDNSSVDPGDKARNCLEHIQSRLREISEISNIPAAMVLENRYPISISIQIPDFICGCNSKKPAYELTNEKDRRQWGLKVSVSNTTACDENDNIRPISVAPNAPGTETTQAATISKKEVTICDAAILQCCHKPLVEISCFASEGCINLDFKEHICSPTNILNSIKRLNIYY